MTRRVGQSAPYVVVVDGVLVSSHKTLAVASDRATAGGGAVGVVVGRSAHCSFRDAWSLTIGQRVKIDSKGVCRAA